LATGPDGKSTALEGKTMRVGDRVTTPDGQGVITATEFYSRLGGGIFRYGVRLDIQRYFYPVAYYWHEELRGL
jgi:hypothetical protein